MEGTPKRSLEEIAEGLESNLLKRMEEFEAQISPGKSALKDVSQLCSEFSAFKNIVWSILKLLRQQISEINKSIDTSEMRHRRKFLVLSGVPESPNEDLNCTVMGILQGNLTMHDLSQADMRSCYRLGAVRDGQTRSILIKFADVCTKNNVWQKKSLLKGSTFVLSEFLTRTRQTVFIAARSAFGMRNVWTLDGNILVKLPNGNRRRIQSNAELNALIASYGKKVQVPVESVSVESGSKTLTTSPRKSKQPNPLKIEPSKAKRSTRK